VKQSTRTLIAAAAAGKIQGKSIDTLYDCTERRYLQVQPSERKAERAGHRLVFENAGDEVVSLEVREDSMFLGWELVSGHFFAGAIHESDILIYDSEDRHYYRYLLN
jgi:hypothetical protein